MMFMTHFAASVVQIEMSSILFSDYIFSKSLIRLVFMVIFFILFSLFQVYRNIVCAICMRITWSVLNCVHPKNSKQAYNLL